MDWIEVTISTTHDGIEPVCGRLYQLDITGVSIDEPTENSKFLKENKCSWDYAEEQLLEPQNTDVTVKIYLTDNVYGNETLLSVRDTINQLKEYDQESLFGSLEISLTNMSQESWENNWKQYFKPLPIGEKILIKPSWETVDDPKGRLVFELDPGNLFGTGLHQTTQLCIISLEKYISSQSALLDLGCGTGILSLIGLLLGAKYAVAVDIDPNAQITAMDNLRRNNLCEDKYSVLSGNILTDDNLTQIISQNKYDICVANIVADVIIQLAPMVKNYLKHDGIFISSGIISQRLDEVKQALADNNFDIIDISRKDDWVSIIAQNK